MDPPADAFLPIARLEPSVDTSSAVVRGVVTLVWPYSASRRSFSVLLVEPDFRLRRHKGQVRVTFKRACAKALARAGIASGDEVRLQLAGCRWLTEDASIQTPGRSVGWELGFDRQVQLELRRQNADVTTITIERSSSPEPLRPFTPPHSRTPVDHASPISPISVLSSASTWSTPAFLRRKKRDSAALLASSQYDFLEDENLNAESAPKRFKFGRGSQQWRVAGRDPSPERQDAQPSRTRRIKFGDEESLPPTQESADDYLESSSKQQPTSPRKAVPPVPETTYAERPENVQAGFGASAPAATQAQAASSSQLERSISSSFESSGQVTPSFPPDEHPANSMTFGSGFTETSTPYSKSQRSVVPEPMESLVEELPESEEQPASEADPFTQLDRREETSTERGDRRNVVSFDFATAPNPHVGGTAIRMPDMSILSSVRQEPQPPADATFVPLSSPTSIPTPSLTNTFFNFDSYNDTPNNLAVTFDMSTVPGPQDLTDYPSSPTRPPAFDWTQAPPSSQRRAAPAMHDPFDIALEQQRLSMVSDVTDPESEPDDPHGQGASMGDSQETEVISESESSSDSLQADVGQVPLSEQREHDVNRRQAPVGTQGEPTRWTQPEIIELSSGDETSGSESESEPEPELEPKSNTQGSAISREPRRDLHVNMRQAPLSDDGKPNSQSETTEITEEMTDDEYQTLVVTESGDLKADSFGRTNVAKESPVAFEKVDASPDAPTAGARLDQGATRPDSTNEDINKDLEILAEPAEVVIYASPDEDESQPETEPFSTEDSESSQQRRQRDIVPEVISSPIENQAPASNLLSPPSTQALNVVPDIPADEMEVDPSDEALDALPESHVLQAAADDHVSESEDYQTTDSDPFGARVRTEVVQSEKKADTEAVPEQADPRELVEPKEPSPGLQTDTLEAAETNTPPSTVTAPPTQVDSKKRASSRQLAKAQAVAADEIEVPKALVQVEERPETADAGSRRRALASERLRAFRKSGGLSFAEAPNFAPSSLSARQTRSGTRQTLQTDTAPAQPSRRQTKREGTRTQAEDPVSPPARERRATRQTRQTRQASPGPAPSQAEERSARTLHERPVPQAPTRRSTRERQPRTLPAPSSTTLAQPADPVSAQLLAEFASGPPPPPPPPPLSQLPVTKGTRTRHAYYTPLSNLHQHVRGDVDALSVVLAISPAQRAPDGPRDWHMTLYVTDVSIATASVGATLRTVQLFRSTRAALPRQTAPGDVLLLHGFKCVTRSRKEMLLSSAASGWAVFTTTAAVSDDEEDASQLEARVEGSPIDYGDQERELVGRMHEWWTGLPEDVREELEEKADMVREQAREAARRRSGRKNVARPGELAHELRNGSRYPFTDSALLHSDEIEGTSAPE